MEFGWPVMLLKGLVCTQGASNGLKPYVYLCKSYKKRKNLKNIALHQPRASHFKCTQKGIWREKYLLLRTQNPVS